MTAMKRPMLRYHGGKWVLAPWIISYFPHHKIYTETYGGGCSVMLRKPRAYAEVYNDLDGEICNVFRMARDHGQQLKELLRLTPFAREDFIESYEPAETALEQARRTIVRSFMGFGSNSTTNRHKTGSRGGKPSTGFRANSSVTTPAIDWKNYADLFDLLIERMRGMVIENRDALEVMDAHDGPNTLHYVDPPYVMATRQDSRADYRFEMTDEQHRQLADFLKTVKGMVVLSGYPSDLYDDLYRDWQRIDRAALADNAKPRVECLWLSPNVPTGRLL